MSDQLTETNLLKLFDLQAFNLLQKGYHKISGLTEEEFRDLLTPLEQKVQKVTIRDKDFEGYIPFVIVIKSDLAPVEKTMPLVVRNNKNGFIKMYPVDPKNFKPIDEVKLPEGMAYLLTDIDRGEQTLNIEPGEALELIIKKNRSPLTIEEGIALLTHYPEFLQKNHCFYLLGSRCGDLRVPALWLSEGKLKLGWCWNGNPHTWLGTASCKSRI